MDPRYLDYLCIALYLGFVIILGSLFGRQQKSTRDYFLAGRSMGWLPLAISMYATLFSSISYIMAPAEAFRGDLQYLISLIFFPVASVLAIVLFIDFFIRLRLTTIFEYLEWRFNSVVSLVLMVGYMLFRCLYAGIVVFSLSLVLHITMGISFAMAIVVIGIGGIIYTTLGGMKAVIWTDVVQFFVLFGGILLALYLAISRIPGGIAEAWQVAGEAEKLRFLNTDLDLTARYTTWTLIPFGIINFLGSKSVDQMNVQRYLSARSPSNAKLALLVQSFFTLPIWLLLYGLGMCLFAYYQYYPSEALDQFVDQKQYDRIFPLFIFQVMPVGVRGFMTAALMAAAMSTMDSVLHVLSTITTTNIYKKYLNPAASDRQCLRIARWNIILWGIIVILAAFSMINIESILKTVESIIGIFIGPMMGIFLLGMFSKRVNWQGVLIGLFMAFATGLGLKFLTEVTFTLYGLSGLIVVLVAGRSASMFFPPPNLEKIDGKMWKWYGWKNMFFGNPAEESR